MDKIDKMSVNKKIIIKKNVEGFVVCNILDNDVRLYPSGVRLDDRKVPTYIKSWAQIL